MVSIVGVVVCVDEAFAKFNDSSENEFLLFTPVDVGDTVDDDTDDADDIIILLNN